MYSDDMMVTWRLRERRHEFEASLCCIGPSVHKKGTSLPLVVVGVVTSPHDQNGREGGSPHFCRLSQNREVILSAFHVSVFLPLTKIVEKNVQA